MSETCCEACPGFELPPADHVRLLFAPPGRGLSHVVVAGDFKRSVALPIRDVGRFVQTLNGERDAYLAQQTFRSPRRLISQIAMLGAMYCDLDFYNGEHAGSPPEEVAREVLWRLDDEQLPPPSYILCSGRGLCVVWLHGFVPLGALGRWNAAQRTLRDALADFGADKMASDAARLFRLSGSRNSKSGQLVRLIWPAFPGDERYSFDELCKAVLPFDRPEVAQWRADRAAARARRGAVNHGCRVEDGSLASVRLADLRTLLDARWAGHIDPGQRDAFALIAASVLAWLKPPPDMLREVAGMVDFVGGWSESETAERISSITRQARAAEEGARAVWAGRKVDARFRWKTETIVDRLSVTEAEMRELDLRALITPDIRRERKTSWQASRRRGAGTMTRDEYEATAAARGERARYLRRTGLTVRAIASETGLSVTQVQRLVRDGAAG